MEPINDALERSGVCRLLKQSNRRDPPRARSDTLPRILLADAADCENGKPHRSANFREARDPLRRSECHFRRRLENRPEENVVSSCHFSFLRICKAVAGNADQKARRGISIAAPFHNFRRGNRFVAQMHARRARCHRHIEPVVDDDAGSARFNGSPRQVEQFPRRQILLANLNPIGPRRTRSLNRGARALPWGA